MAANFILLMDFPLNIIRGGGDLWHVILKEFLESEDVMARYPKMTEPVKAVCPHCSKEFEMKRPDYNHRLKQSYFKRLFCSRTCSFTYTRLNNLVIPKDAVRPKKQSKPKKHNEFLDLGKDFTRRVV